MEGTASILIELTLWSKLVGFLLPLLTIIVNSIEIHVIGKTRKKPYYEKILLSLSFCDLIGGICASGAVPFVSIVKNESYIILFWNVWLFGFCYIMLNTLLHLIMISADRLWAIGAPLHHRIYASHRKLTLALALGWCLPLTFVFAIITLILVKEMVTEEVYLYACKTMLSHIAKIVVITDFLLILCYCAIIWIVLRVKRHAKERKTSKQSKSLNTLILCISIVFVFVLFTTPFAAVNVTIWNNPHWLMKLGIFLLPLNQIFNSIIYLLLKRRSKRMVNAPREDIRLNMKCGI